MVLSSIPFPIIQAPMAGGVSNPKLAAAVSNAGGLGFLAGGYKTAVEMREEILQVRQMTHAPFGVNIFIPGSDTVHDDAILQYRDQLEKVAERFGITLGRPIYDDDDWEAKIRTLKELQVPVVSFTFGCPPAEVIQELKSRGSYIIVTVTSPTEALIASQAGADALCVQGIEAGGHRASFENNPDNDEDYGLLVLLQLIRNRVDLPLIAAGGLMEGRDIAAVLMAGACAAQLGTAFLRCPESGANRAYKAALADPRFTATAVTRAFTGRRARGLVNRFMRDYGRLAPAAYPHVHHMTKELRKAAGASNNPDFMSLLAGQGYAHAKEIPAAQLVRMLIDETSQMFDQAHRLWKKI